MKHICLVILLAMLSGEMALACGKDSDCQVGSRSYRIYLPPGADKETAPGAIVYAHGYKGSSKGVMSNKGMIRLADDLGVALIALSSHGDDWNIEGVPSGSKTEGVDEFAYVGDVLQDAEQRFGIDRTRLLSAGFSAGGMLVWNLACHMGDSFAGFLPISGTFWRPVPASCDSPAASLIHIHGTQDRVVPLGGRRIADTYQGNVTKAFEMYRRYGKFRPAGETQEGSLSCTLNRNTNGQELDLCLFEGGHSFRAGFVGWAWNRLIGPS